MHGETIVGVQSIARDITDRKRMEETLRENEKRFRLFYERSPLSYQSLDADGRLIEVNQAWLAMLGYERHEVIGRWFVDFLLPEYVEFFREGFSRFVELGESHNVEFEILHKSGIRIMISCDGRIGYDEDGRFVQTHCVLQHVSERKRLEKERLETERSLLHAQKLESLAVMAGGIAHDFNNQLSVVLGNLELALTDKTLHPDARYSITSAVEAAKRSAELSRQVQIYTGNTFYYPIDLDLNELLNTNPIPPKLRVSRHVTLDLESDNRLPLIKGDPDQIQCLVTNILVNASEAFGDKDGEVRLSTGVMDCDEAYLRRSRLEEKPEPGWYVFLEVTDTGCGMDAETQRRLFDPFFSTKFWGRGLGMSKVIGITKGHHGAIIVDSEVGKGTTIRVLFPAPKKVQASFVQVMDVVETEAPVSDDATRRKTILIVEDEALVRDLAVKRLELLGYGVITAVDGEEGVRVFQDRLNEIDLVMLDFKMPKMDGVEAFHELIRIKPDVKVMLCSGYIKDVVIERFPGRRPAGILHKPYDMDILKAELERLLESDG
jgi:PAS domain S-box-containing protein